jgi:hypothetical protein
MAINLSAFDSGMSRAICHFWSARMKAVKRQRRQGTGDQGNRSGVTAGKNMDGFIALVRQIIRDNGLDDTEIHTGLRGNLTLPGFFRPTKNWDLLVVSRGRRVAAVEFKSQVGPSFGNNFNNRVEEALGNATDLNTAYREGAFGDSPKPFLGYFFTLEECPASMAPVRFVSPHFSARPEFENTSYAARYEILCRKFVQEQLYDAAALVLTEAKTAPQGAFRFASTLTSAERFAATLAGKIAGMAAQ